jgi:hypothetical protein
MPSSRLEAPLRPSPSPCGPAPGGLAGFAFPEPPETAAGIVLDLRKIEARLAESERVASLLEEVFREEEPAGAVPAAETCAALDAVHSAFLRELAASTTWNRAEVERLAASFGLLPDGALEVLNEAAFALWGASVIEGDELLAVDTEILENLLA